MGGGERVLDRLGDATAGGHPVSVRGRPRADRAGLLRLGRRRPRHPPTLLHRVQLPQTAAPALSAREIAVLAHAAEGRTNAAIGAAMHISETTVKTYLARAFDKLGASDRTSAVRRAIDLGLIR